MERGSTIMKDRYERIIDTHRDNLTDDELGVLLALHEEGDVYGAAMVLGMSTEEVLAVIDKYTPKMKERARSLDEPYKRRLSQEAFKAILTTHDFDEEERKIVSAMIDRPNQVVAALDVDMSYKEYSKRFLAIRRKYDF